MTDNECVVGIDLGTTYSEIAAYVGDRVKVLGPGKKMLPSCVGISPSGELLVGEPAFNQQLLYPNRTVRSIKRKMGTEEKTVLGDRSFSPEEISALILRALFEWTQGEIECPSRKAVITVPAYFSDAQRAATREAGALAGLEVVRILNEPTAASLAYGYGEEKEQTVLIYDLGGGTFDVSLVKVEGDVTEVLASHGNNHLGGDDFDALLVDRLAQEFQEKHSIDLRKGYDAAYSRLWWAAEEAKIGLSAEPYVTVREENLISVSGKPLHLELEICRDEYEDMIRSLVESTLESVSKALADAGTNARDLDSVLLVGGSTRTPMIVKTLEERTGLVPRQDVHPDLCVALGAGVMASRLSGREVDRVLVDVSPFSFGISYLGERGGLPYSYCYHPIIKRNTPLPVTRTERYQTSMPMQTAVAIHVYQGDDPDALRNIPVGNFTVEELTPTYEPNEVLCRLSLDLDGILHVTAIEKMTGKSKHVTIDNALQQKSEKEIAAMRKRIEDLFSTRPAFEDDELEDFEDGEGEDIPDEEDLYTDGEEDADMDPEWKEAVDRANEIVNRSRGLFGTMHEEDTEDAIEFHERIETAISEGNREELAAAVEGLKELLFFVEGK